MAAILEKTVPDLQRLAIRASMGLRHRVRQSYKRIKGGPLHVQWPKDFFGHQCCKSFATDDLSEIAGQNQPRITVGDDRLSNALDAKRTMGMSG